jgi:TonB-dependent SusC/RagA subfamily outer membrane receptor
MQNLQLSIPEPCHENWQQMTPTEQGRFCNACAKEVIDFSSMTDIQVLNYFTNLTHEKVCGRALPEQLDRTISRPEQPKKRLFWYWNYVVMFLMFFIKGNNVAAQSCTKPATELTPVNNANLRGEMIVMDELKKNGSHVVTGKVTDKDGNPVSFASIKIKGANTGISADANGAYSIKAQPNNILIISGASFVHTEVPLGIQTVVNTVLEKSSNSGLIEVVAGGISFRNSDDYYGPEDRLNNVAVLAVKDELSGKAIEKASIAITKNSKTDSVLTDKKGVYKLKGIKKHQEYFIKVIADGYEANEFIIDASDFKDRKKEWDVLLRKQKIEITRPTKKEISETTVRIRGNIIALNTNNEPLYLVDGTLMPKKMDINPDDIENISVLKSAEATALFGPDGSNGAIIITTKKLKVKSLDTVTVTASSIKGQLKRIEATTTYCSSVMGGMVPGYTITINNKLTDSLKMITTKITGAIKIYPNPVQRGNTFNITLKLKQAGFYQLQITDATGRIVLQKQINANTKDHTEKIIADIRWGSGVYYVSIIDNKMQLISKAGFIFQ